MLISSALTRCFDEFEQLGAKTLESKTSLGVPCGKAAGVSSCELGSETYPAVQRREGSHADRCTIIANILSPGKSASLDFGL